MKGTSAVSSRMRGIEGMEKCSWCVCGLLEMGGDSLLMHLCGNLLELGSKAKGGRRCGQIAPADLHVWLPICETCLPCPLSGCLSDCFSCPRMIGLIEWLRLLAFF